MAENCPKCGAVSEQEFERRINFTCGTSVYGGFLYEDVNIGYPANTDQSDTCRANAAEGKLAEAAVRETALRLSLELSENELARLQEMQGKLRGELTAAKAAGGDDAK